MTRPRLCGVPDLDLSQKLLRHPAARSNSIDDDSIVGSSRRRCGTAPMLGPNSSVGAVFANAPRVARKAVRAQECRHVAMGGKTSGLGTAVEWAMPEPPLQAIADAEAVPKGDRLMSALGAHNVKVFGCRPMKVARRSPGPASANSKGGNRRRRGEVARQTLRGFGSCESEYNFCDMARTLRMGENAFRGSCNFSKLGVVKTAQITTFAFRA
jgi:hypothetical protein